MPAAAPVGTPGMAGPEDELVQSVAQAAGPGEQPVEPDEQPAGAIEATAPAARRRIGEILVERGKLDPLALERTLRLQESNVAAGGKRERLGELLVTLGLGGALLLGWRSLYRLVLARRPAP